MSFKSRKLTKNNWNVLTKNDNRCWVFIDDYNNLRDDLLDIAPSDGTGTFDVINEDTADTGVTVEGVLFKDGYSTYTLTAGATNTIDAATTPHTGATVLDINVEVATTSSVNAVDVAISHDTGMTGGTEIVKGFNVVLTGLAGNANGAAVHGYYVDAAAVTGERADYSGYTVDISSVRDTSDTDAGLTVGFTGTLNDSGATWYGTRVAGSTGTFTDGDWYGHHIGHNTASSANIYGVSIDFDGVGINNDAKVGFVISKGLVNSTAVGALANNSRLLELFSTNATSATASGATSVTGYMATLQQVNSTAVATADIYSGTVFGTSYSATTTGAGTATSNATALEVDYNLNATFAGLSATAFDVATIDYDTVGAVDFAAGAYNLLSIYGNDAGTPTHTAGSILSGINLDLSGIDYTDADLTVYGLNLSMPSALAASTVAHLHADTSIVTDMPVPAVGADIDNPGTAINAWIPYGKKGTSGLTVTEFYIDLAGLSSVATDGDVIGDTGQTTSATLGQYTVAIQGATIVAIEMVCLEAPTAGDADIDLYSNASGTLSIDDAAGGGTQLIAAGESWTNGMVKGATDVPTATHYFYLTSGAGAAGDYSQGKFLIRFYGI